MLNSLNKENTARQQPCRNAHWLIEHWSKELLRIDRWVLYFWSTVWLNATSYRHMSIDMRHESRVYTHSELISLSKTASSRHEVVSIGDYWWNVLFLGYYILAFSKKTGKYSNNWNGMKSCFVLVCRLNQSEWRQKYIKCQVAKRITLFSTSSLY